MDKKKYVDYVSLVCFYGLQKDFQVYCRKHRGISIRRNARNFLLKSGKYNDLKYFREKGFDLNWQFDLDQMIKIAKTPWLENK